MPNQDGLSVPAGSGVFIFLMTASRSASSWATSSATRSRPCCRTLAAYVSAISLGDQLRRSDPLTNFNGATAVRCMYKARAPNTTMSNPTGTKNDQVGRSSRSSAAVSWARTRSSQDGGAAWTSMGRFRKGTHVMGGRSGPRFGNRSLHRKASRKATMMAGKSQPTVDVSRLITSKRPNGCMVAPITLSKMDSKTDGNQGCVEELTEFVWSASWLRTRKRQSANHSTRSAPDT